MEQSPFSMTMTMDAYVGQTTDIPLPADVLTRRVIQCMAYVTLAILVVSCNAFILILLKSHKELFDMTTVFFYQALAVVNMLAGLFGAVYGIIMGPSSVWPLDQISCAVLLRGHFLFLYQSAWILCSISVDRFLMINWPLRYPTIVTPTRAKAGLVMILVLSIVPMIPILPIEGFPLFESQIERCAGNPFQIQGSDLAWVGVLFVFIAVPLITSTTANVCMMRTALRQRRRIEPTSHLVPSHPNFDGASSSPLRPRTNTMNTTASYGSSVQHSRETIICDLTNCDTTLSSTLPNGMSKLCVDAARSHGTSVCSSIINTGLSTSDRTVDALALSPSRFHVKPARSCESQDQSRRFNVTCDLTPASPTLDELSMQRSFLPADMKTCGSSTNSSDSRFRYDRTLSHLTIDVSSTNPSRLRTDPFTSAASSLHSSRSSVTCDSRSFHQTLGAISTISSRLRSNTATSLGSNIIQRPRDKTKAAAALSRHSAQLKTLRTIVAMTIAYYISWLPISAYFILHSTGGSASVSQEFYFFALGMDICACWWNIIVYVITNAPLRRAAKNMMKCRRSNDVKG